MKLKFAIISSLFLIACGNTGIVKMEENRYMVSVKNAKLGYVTAAEEKADAYNQANGFCEKQGMEVETLNLETRNSGAFQSASATLEFRCIHHD